MIFKPADSFVMDGKQGARCGANDCCPTNVVVMGMAMQYKSQFFPLSALFLDRLKYRWDSPGEP